MRIRTDKDDKKKYSFVDYNFYKDSNQIPIEAVADILGLRKDASGRYSCAFHNDTHPSMVINKSGRYGNTCHCFACNTSGDPLTLTMAVRSHVNPNDYYNKPALYKEEREDAVQFLEVHFPGAIQKNSNNPKYRDDFPVIPTDFLKEIGLTSDINSRTTVIHPYRLSTKKLRISDYEFLSTRNDAVIFDSLTPLERAELIIQKSTEYIGQLDLYRMQILKVDFPAMPAEARRYINYVVANKEEIAKSYIRQLEAYMKEHSKDDFSEIEDLTKDAEAFRTKNDTKNVEEIER